MHTLTTELQFPEGPIAMQDGSVIVVEIAAGTITRVTADGTRTTVASPGGGPNGAAIGPDGKLYVCNNGGFSWTRADGLLIPGDTPARDLVMSHISTNFDRSGFQQDINVALPIDRLRELAADGVVGSVADYHYSFMGATDPMRMQDSVARMVDLLKSDAVDTVLLVPI